MSGSIYFVIVLIICTCRAAPAKDQFAMEDPWKELVELLRKFLREGYPQGGIPPLDPFEVKYKDLELAQEYFKIRATIQEGVFNGLSKFEINTFVISKEELTVEFDVSFPSLNLSAEHYEMEGDLLEAIPLAGQGILHFEVYDFSLSCKIHFKKNVNSEIFLVNRYENAGFSVSRILSKTQYDGNFDAILNAMVEDLLAGYLNRFNKFLTAALLDRIIDPLNNILANL